jgi:hypothetical protein
MLSLGVLCILVNDASARDVRVLVFNAPVNAAYDAQLNTITQRTIASSQAGSLDYTFNANDGDQISFSPADLAPPPAPVLASVTPDGGGCALVTWLPSGDPTVVGYVVYAGTRSVASGVADHYDIAVDAGSGSNASVCSLPPGVNYIAVRARNYAGVLSAFSAEQAVTITTVSVLITSFGAKVQDLGVQLSWDVEADEVVQGYRVYRSEEDEPETAIVDELLSSDTREFLDEATESATSYEYVLGATKEDGSEIRSAPVAIATPALAFNLEQNAPNPFNPVTRIPFTLDRATRAVLRVYNVHGALVATLLEEQLGEGRHEISWDGRDNTGQTVSSGIYIYALTANKKTVSRKMTLLK